jgi:hypothetical protein
MLWRHSTASGAAVCCGCPFACQQHLTRYRKQRPNHVPKHQAPELKSLVGGRSNIPWLLGCFLNVTPKKRNICGSVNNH